MSKLKAIGARKNSLKFYDKTLRGTREREFIKRAVECRTIAKIQINTTCDYTPVIIGENSVATEKCVIC